MNKKIITSIIYCTDNILDKSLETKVIKLLRENSNDLPIISVSRKPIKLGTNICVGEKVPVCESSKMKMLLKGLRQATTENVVVAFPDCLYPPEYFSFNPKQKDTLYQYENVWTLGDKYWKKKFLEGAQGANRKYWMEILKEALTGQTGWDIVDIKHPISNKIDYLSWTSGNPVVRLITDKGTQKFSNIDRKKSPQKQLPYWGSVSELKTKMGL